MRRREFAKLTGVAGTAALGGVGTGAGALPTDDTLAEIELRTDEYGVSHVYVGDPDEREDGDLYALAYGNGYVQARDRLFEMDAARHVARGTASEAIGPGQLPSDIQVRRDLYNEREIERLTDAASPTARTVLRGFADGVNRRMTEMAARGELPAEFAALGHAPEPWQPEDTTAIVTYSIGLFGVRGGNELSNARQLNRFVREGEFESLDGAFRAYGDITRVAADEDHYTSLTAADVADGELAFEDPPETPEELGALPERQREFLRAATENVQPWGIDDDVTVPETVTNGQRVSQGIMKGFRWGSNAMVVSGERTATGQPMMFGGPQTGLSKPSFLYEVGLHGAGFECSGIGVVGTPSLVIGRTPDAAWSITTGYDDMVDTIAVELDPEEPTRYRWNGTWYEMATETVVHRSSPAGSALAGETRVVEQQVARVEQEGDSMPVVAWNPDPEGLDHPVAWVQRTTSRFEELDSAFMWAQLGRTASFEEFRDQIEEFAFTFNFHYADREQVGYLHMGSVPERSPELDPRFPASAADHEWRDVHTGLGLGANATDPERGYVVNWNNAPAPNWYGGDQPRYFGAVQEVDALDEAMQVRLEETGGELTIGDVAGVLEDAATHDIAARWFVPDLEQAAKGDPDLQPLADALAAWREADDVGYPWTADDMDGDGEREYVHEGHAIWDETRRQLQSRLLADEFGDTQPRLQFEPLPGSHAVAHEDAGPHLLLYRVLQRDTEYDWLDGEPKVKVLRDALRDAREALAERFDSPEVDDWHEPEHTLKFSPLGATEQVEIPMQARGSWNQVVDLSARGRSADPAVMADHSGGVLPPGNSGHISVDEFGRAQATGEEPDRLTNQLDRYANFEFKPLPVTREQVTAVTDSRTVLTAEEPALDAPVQPTGKVTLPGELGADTPTDGPVGATTTTPPGTVTREAVAALREGETDASEGSETGGTEETTGSDADADASAGTTAATDRDTGHVTDPDELP